MSFVRMSFAPWRIVHLDLCRPLPVLIVPPGARGLYVVYWRGDVPLGHVYLPRERFPLVAAQLREVALEAIAPAVGGYFAPVDAGWRGNHRAHDYLGAARTRHVLTRVGGPTASPVAPTAGEVSVVVCTRERPAALGRCLSALAQLTPAPLEILVVDNAPRTDATRRLVAQMSGVRYLCEPRPGLDIARNTGLRHARGAVVAYTDDDVEVHPRWVRSLAAAFEDPKVMAVTGLTLPAQLDTEAQVLFEHHWSFNRGFQPKRFGAAFFAKHRATAVPVWTLGAGANMAFRRAVVERVGPFDERLDVGAAGCNGDSEMWYRVLAAGYACRYEPTAVVFHHHRRELVALKRQLFYYMRGHAAALLIQYERHGHTGNLRRFGTLARYYTRQTLRGTRAGFRGRYRTVPSEIAGTLAGIVFYLRHRQPSGMPARPDTHYAVQPAPCAGCSTAL